MVRVQDEILQALIDHALKFKLNSPFSPTGDQPQAIDLLTQNIKNGIPYHVLQGVTGSGKTFTMANVMANLNRPTLILSHNKTLAAQLYGEFKHFFPENAVEYFVSYYDYYQPEAYLPTSDTYIEKDLAINDDIERMRISATSSLLSGRRDVIVVSSVSCLYGLGNPDDFHANTIRITRNEDFKRQELLRALVDSLYTRSDNDFKRGCFRVNGDTIDIWVASVDIGYRIVQWGDFIEHIQVIDPRTGQILNMVDYIDVPPASNFVTTKERIVSALGQIRRDMEAQYLYFINRGEDVYAKRLKQRVEYDLEMIEEVGYCSGIENYSRYFDGRAAGTRPFCLLDYFPKDYLLFIDESHVTVGQVRGMQAADMSRKNNLVDFGFRLPAAKDNRPLSYPEFEALQTTTVFVSATPDEFEIKKAEGVLVEQIIRPTGLLDPPIEVRPTVGQIDNLMGEIEARVAIDERILVTTLTKRMAEELTKFLDKNGIRTRYIHSDVDTLERVQIMDDLRAGRFDVLVGVNLLREGLDLPEVSLVAIMDADKEGFLRSERSLTQTAGRAARNTNGLVIMYADTVTKSMDKTINSSNYRRCIQMKYNTDHGLVPMALNKKVQSTMGETLKQNMESERMAVSAQYFPTKELRMTPQELDKAIEMAKNKMETSAKELDFLKAAIYRDEMYELQKLRDKKR